MWSRNEVLKYGGVNEKVFTAFLTQFKKNGWSHVIDKPATLGTTYVKLYKGESTPSAEWLLPMTHNCNVPNSIQAMDPCCMLYTSLSSHVSTSLEMKKFYLRSKDESGEMYPLNVMTGFSSQLP